MHPELAQAPEMFEVLPADANKKRNSLLGLYNILPKQLDFISGPCNPCYMGTGVLGLLVGMNKAGKVSLINPKFPRVYVAIGWHAKG